MAIYLVRWPGLTASLVRAESEEHLVDILDQAANSDWCEWSVYDGPLAIDLRLPAEWSIRDERRGDPIAPDQVMVGDLGPLAQRYVISAMEVDFGVEEEGVQMGETVLQKAFPNVHAAVEWLFTKEGVKQQPDAILPEPRLRQALHAELARMLKASWRQARLHRKTDRTSIVASQMDMPVAIVRRLAAEIDAGEDDGHREPDDGPAEQAPLDAPLFKASNHHAQSRGKAPIIDGDAQERYAGYFVNEYGEQAVYVYNDFTGEAAIRMGDTGWERSYSVVDGEVAGPNLTEAERTWIRACWLATGALRR